MPEQKRTRGGRLGAAITLLRSALWPIPCLGVVVAVALGVLLPEVDAWWSGSGDDPLAFVFGGGPSAARDVLAAIAGSLISVTGLTFSLTVVALQLSSSQYSPRLLQTFVTDRVVQATLAQLALTFVYALTVLRTVRDADATDNAIAFVPRLSITVAYLLTIVSVVSLIFFLGHLARALRVETMLRDVHDEASRTIGSEGESTSDTGPSATGRVWPDGTATPIVSRSSGFLIGINEKAAARAAQQAGLVVRLRVRFGDAVVAGTPVAHAWADSGGEPADVAELEEALHGALRLDYERSAARDVAYGLRKIMDIVVRALSPGINDPTTAVHALSHASAVLSELAERPAVNREIRDDGGTVRIVIPAWELPALLHLVMEESLMYAEGQPAVLRRLAAVLREFAWRAQELDVGELIVAYTDRTAELATRTAHITEDEARAWQRRVAQALDGRWPVEPLSAS